MAGTAALCPEFRFIHKGLELANSYCFNPHKWMFTNFDCDCFFVADRKDLIQALSILPEYLKNKATESGAVIDYRDWQIPLGRRFRALKLWFVIRHYGIEGLQYHIRRHVELFRHKAGDEFNQKLLEKLNHSGKIYLTHTRLNEKFTLRFCVGQTHTEACHVENAWKLIQAYSNQLEKELN